MPVPRHVAKWHGYPEQKNFEPTIFTNNRFMKDEHRTNFNELTPFRARERAVELARSKNAKWLPDGISQQYHYDQRNPYEQYHSLIDTLRRGSCHPAIATMIQPVLQILIIDHEVNNNENNVEDEDDDTIIHDDSIPAKKTKQQIITMTSNNNWIWMVAPIV
jgi:hypothetical protein